MASLHSERTGRGPTVVLAHGFTQTGRLWGPLAQTLARDRTVVRVDLPGHGGSADVSADLVSGAELVVEAAGDGPFDLVGYSLGARLALHAALAHPDRVHRLVLISGTAGLVDPAARAARRARDDQLADELEAGGDLDRFLQRWLANPMFARLGPRAAGLEERRRNTPVGLASSLRRAGTGTQEPLWDRLGTLGMPLLALAGTTDERFAAHALRLARTVPDGVASLVPGAGHAAHLEQPALTGVVVGHWLGTPVPDRP